ncbi:MAG: hypothetical protein WC828_04955 [Thermoleophilia bacterium]|jgi:hypothetical protein
MSTPTSNIPGQRHFNWKVFWAIMAVVAIAVGLFIGVGIWQNNRAINDTTPNHESTFGYGSSQSQDAAYKECKQKVEDLIDEYGVGMGVEFYKQRTGCGNDPVVEVLLSGH